MPFRIAVACVTWCHSGICQSGERIEEKQVFVHHGSLKSNKDLDNTVLGIMLTLLHEVIIKCWWQFGKLYLCRSCLLKMPAVLQLALLKKFRKCSRCAFWITLCLILPDLGVLKITPLKTNLSVWWCAISFTRPKKQGPSMADSMRCNSMVETWTAMVYKGLLHLLSPFS